MFKPFNGRVSMICDLGIRLGTTAISFAPRRFVQRSSEWMWEDTTKYGHFASNFPRLLRILYRLTFYCKRSFVTVSIIF